MMMNPLYDFDGSKFALNHNLISSDVWATPTVGDSDLAQHVRGSGTVADKWSEHYYMGWSGRDNFEAPLYNNGVVGHEVTDAVDNMSHQLAFKLSLLDSGSDMIPRFNVGYGFSNQDQPEVLAPNPRFKTEICRNFKEKATCLYGDLCQFAHGRHELRKDVVRHNKYKTKLCQKYWIAGYCAYGPRCNFIHQEKEGLMQIQTASKHKNANSQFMSMYRPSTTEVSYTSVRNKGSLGEEIRDSGSGSDDPSSLGNGAAIDALIRERNKRYAPSAFPMERVQLPTRHTLIGSVADYGFGSSANLYGMHQSAVGIIGSGRREDRAIRPGA